MDYNDAILKQQKSNQSLSERLDWITRMNADLVGRATDQNESQPRAALENPFNMAKTSMGLGNQSLLYGQNARADLEAGQKALMELFGLQQSDASLSETARHNQAVEALDLLKLQGEGNSVEKLPVSTRNALTENMSALKDLKRVKGMFKTSAGDLISDISAGETGPLSKLFGPYGDFGALRTAIDVIGQGIRKDAYGSAFTDTERKESSFIPASGKQETTNIRNLNEQIKRQETKVKTTLSNAGWTEAEIQDYLAKNLDSAPSYLDAQLNSGPSTINNDPLGLGL